MGSAIDAGQPVDGVAASKAALRQNLQAARDELNHGGFFTGSGAGALERTSLSRLGELPRLTDYGSDAGALSRALGAHDVVVVPPGLYDWTPPAGYSGYADKTIIGHGAVIRASTRITFQNCQRLCLRGLGFDGNAHAGTFEALAFDGCSDIVVDDCSFKDVKNNALRLEGGCDGIVVVRSRFMRIGAIDKGTAATDHLTRGACIYVPSGQGIGRLTIASNEMVEADGHAINLSSDAGAVLEDVVIRNNRIRDAMFGGVLVQGTAPLESAVIDTNTITGCGRNQPAPGSATFCHAIRLTAAGDPHQVQITGNFIRDCEDAAIVAGAIVKGNSIRGVGARLAELGQSRGGVAPAPEGIRLQGGEAYGNMIVETAHHGIRIVAGDVSVARNVMHAWNRAGGAARHAVHYGEGGTLERTVIEGNVAYGIAQGGADRMLDIAGQAAATTVVQHNHGYDCQGPAVADAGVSFRNRLNGVLI